METRKSVYIETTIPSYITARDSINMEKLYRQSISRRFWIEEREKYNLFTSRFVIDECAKGDPEAAKRRLDLIDGITILESNDEIARLALVYRDILGIPERAKLDATHLAIAAYYEMDYVLSWNFAHMSIVAYRKMLVYNEKHDLKTPLLERPETLLPEEDKDELL